MASLDSTEDRARRDNGFVLVGHRLGDEIGVLAPESADRLELVRAFLEERDITYPVGLATRAHRLAFGGINGIPTTFIIDRDGTVRHRVVGYFAGPAMNAAVSRLLEEDAAGP